MSGGAIEPLQGSFGQVRAALTRWFVHDAMPVWTTHGCDWRAGGFYERLDDRYVPTIEPRRARLVSRQIYVFACARGLGWDGPSDALMQHGLAYLCAHYLCDDGRVWSSVLDGRVVQPDYDLYDYAFVLFALAAAARKTPDCEMRALRLVTFLRGKYRHPCGGFEDAVPRRLPLRSNPHMHMLEACLAWVEAGSSHAAWTDIADEIAELAMSRLIDPSSGALGELFDADWRPMADPSGILVEPGHQFEWAWLLNWWSDLRKRTDARTCAARLMQVGENHGMNADGYVINELHGDLSRRDAAARLWPQTERIKAWCDRARRTTCADERAVMLQAAANGAHVLLNHFAAAPRGLWREVREDDGGFRAEPCRASSLYHIVGAIHAMHGVDLPMSTGVR